MKKIYFCLSFLLTFFGVMTVHATDVVTEKGNYVTSLDQLTEGTKILLYCQGQITDDLPQYGTRNAFISEDSEGKCWLNRKDFVLGNRSTSSYIWVVEEVSDNGYGGKRVKFKAPSGNYLSTFAENNAQAVTDIEGGYFSIDPLIESGDSIFIIGDENSLYMNGQDVGSAGEGLAKCVGWNVSGGNSQYMIYIPTIENKETMEILYNVYDLATGEATIPGYEEAILENMFIGEELTAPSIEHYDFVRAVNADNEEEEVELPYTITEESEGLFLLFYYECWPLINVSFVDTEGNVLKNPVDKYYRKGSKLDALPSFVGYKVSEESQQYADYTISEDETITIVYEKDASALPFEATTIVDGKLSPDTKYYRIGIRGSKYLKLDSEGLGILCEGNITEVNDSSLWAFTGNTEDGFKIYSKLFGAEKIVYADNGSNQTELTLQPVEETLEPNTFDLTNNDTGFSFKLHGTENSWWNDFGGNGVLRFWESGAGGSDIGGRLTFEIFTEEMAQAIRFAPYVQYVNAEGCVGGWTAEQLADMKKAIEEKNLDGCKDAVAVLEQTETIAFDVTKKYVLISALKDYILKQPGKQYALCTEADTTIMLWKELNAESELFQWGFTAATDTTYYLENVARNTYAASFRFGQDCPLVHWSEPAVVGPEIPWNKAEGVPADFEIKKSHIAPAAFILKHTYMVNAENFATFITLAGFGKTGINDAAAATEGSVKTYNTLEDKFNNYWRLKPVGDFTTGISDTIVAAPGQQTNTIYDLSGRRVEKAVKGLYIINGKKVLVK